MTFISFGKLKLNDDICSSYPVIWRHEENNNDEFLFQFRLLLGEH